MKVLRSFTEEPMYKPIETVKTITMDNGTVVEPVASLQAEQGAQAHFIVDGGCYALVTNGTLPLRSYQAFRMTKWIFPEAMRLLRELPPLPGEDLLAVSPDVAPDVASAIKAARVRLSEKTLDYRREAIVAQLAKIVANGDARLEHAEIFNHKMRTEKGWAPTGESTWTFRTFITDDELSP
jgi:hypothetical protein